MAIKCLQGRLASWLRHPAVFNVLDGLYVQFDAVQMRCHLIKFGAFQVGCTPQCWTLVYRHAQHRQAGKLCS